MPTYRDPSGVLVTTPEPLSDEQLDGVVTGALSIPGVTVDRGTPSPDAKPTLPPPSGPTQPPRDLIGRVKAWATKPPTPGATDVTGFSRDNPVANTIRTVGGAVMPGSWPDLATDAALTAIPGYGLAKSALRGAAATGAGVGTAGLMGESMEDQALKSGVSSVLGEGAGGAARAAARWGQGAFSQTTKNFGDLVGRLVPSFKGATPQETVAKLANGTGYNQLGKDYGTAVQGVLTQHGDPVVLVPALERFGKSPAMPASSALEAIQSIRRGLFSGGGDLARAGGAMEKAGWIEDAMREWQDALAKQLPPASMKVMDAAKANYARGMSILRVMGEGHEHMSKEALESLIQKGRINEPGIEKSFFLNEGKLRERFTPEEYAAMEKAIRRGEQNPLAMSQVGKPSKMSMGHGARVPYMSIPHAPIRIGKPEEVADLVSRVFRLLGATTAQSTLSE